MSLSLPPLNQDENQGQSSSEESGIIIAAMGNAQAARDEQQSQAYELNNAMQNKDQAILETDILQQAELVQLESRLKETKRITKLAKFFFLTALILSVLMLSYFYYATYIRESDTGFKGSLTIKTAIDNKTKLEAAYNIRIYQLTEYIFASLNWKGLEFLSLLQATQNGELNAIEQANTERELKNVRAEIQQLFTQLQSLMSKLSFAGSDNAKTDRANLIEQLPDNLKKSNAELMIRNGFLFDTFTSANRLVQIEKLDNAAFSAWISEFLAQSRLPESTIIQLQSERLLWSEVIQGIEDVTKQIDPNFGNSDQFITYSAYNFNSRTKQLTVTGQIKTEDSRTFTKIADLIDTLIDYKNPAGIKPFQNVKTRSFNKNQLREGDNPQEHYEATVKLDFELTNLKPELPSSISVTNN